jgi:predicted O-linked N-acetylglucosamine transferase (SPINDLY family)
MTVEDVFKAAVSQHQAGNVSAAEQLYQQILLEVPDHGPTLHYLGLLLQSAGQLEQAVSYLRRAVASDPGSAICQNNLANLLRQQGHLDEAIRAYEAALRLEPDYVNAQYNLASLLLDRAAPADAAIWYRKLVEADPDDAEALNGLGIALKELGQLDESAAYMERAIAVQPENPVAHYNLGLVRKLRDDFPGAASAFREAARIDPNYVSAYLSLASVLFDQEDYEAAEAACRSAIDIAPEHVEAYTALGNVLLRRDRSNQAEGVYRQALALAPNDINALHGLGNALLNQSKLDEAISFYRLVPASDALYPIAQNNLGNCLQKQGRFDPAIAAFRRALSAKRDFVEAHSNMLFCSNYLPDVDSKALFKEHQLWAEKHSDHLGQRVSFRSIDMSPGRRLRIGYLSPNFCIHSVAYFIDAVLEYHDRSAFQVICYSNSLTRDQYTERLRALSDGWHDVYGMDDDTVAEMIRDHAIDILVDLAGHTGGNRLLVMARRPAPVLVNYLGYPNTTGVKQIAYRITDAWADPPGVSEAVHTEKLLRLPSGFLCFRSPSACPDVLDPPLLREGHVTFASFNNTAKVNGRVVDVWSRILRALPDARLLIKSRHVADAEARRVLLDNFSEHGVAKDRIEIVPGFLPRDDHLRLYGRVDIGLDPFPYNGTTTTCEALWMGVPVVTLDGDTHRGRVGVSLLNQVGLPELIAATESEYVRLAGELAKDPDRLVRLRRGLRERMAASPLMDARGTVHALESSYRTAWRIFCQGTNEGIAATARKN